MSIPRSDPLKTGVARAPAPLPQRGIQPEKLKEGSLLTLSDVTPTTIGAAAAGHNHAPLNNYAATAAPTVNDDATKGFSVGSEWVDVSADNSYQCQDATEGAAVWAQTDVAGGVSDADAIHDNVAAEISAITEKVTPVDADLVIIEDSAAGNAKKKAQLGNLPGGGVTDHGALTGLLDDDHTQYQKESEKDAASGYAGLTAATKLNLAQMQEVMALDGLSDVVITSPTVGEVLTHDGGSFVNAAASAHGNHHATATASGAHTVSGQDIIAVAASTTLAAHVELATIAETDTGTDATRAVTPDGLAGSNYGERAIGILVSDPGGDAITVGDGKAYFRVPSSMNGFNLVEVAASLSTVSSSGIPTVQIRRSRRSTATTRTNADMLSTKLTIDASEFDSEDAAAAAVIDTANDDVNTGDHIYIDIDVAGTGAKGLFVLMVFRLP